MERTQFIYLSSIPGLSTKGFYLRYSAAYFTPYRRLLYPLKNCFPNALISVQEKNRSSFLRDVL